MTSLSEDASNQNEALDALQALIHDGTPDEIAGNFKAQGNDYVKAKRYREALGFYNQAIDSKPTDQALIESLLLNRAVCNLELKNYGSVLRDCSKVLSSNMTSLKALYRSALALIALERPVEAIDCCERGLLVDPESSGLISALSKAKNLKEKQEERERLKVQKLQAQKREEQRLSKALKIRNIIIVSSPGGDTSSDMRPVLSADDPPNLTLPVIFLYPQYSQSDIISAFDEHSVFTEHLDVMFPPAGARPGWDVTGEYIVPSLSLYAQTKRKRLLKIGKKMTLADLCQSAAAKPGEEADGLEMVDGHLSIIVLLKGDVEKRWIDEFKRERGF